MLTTIATTRSTCCRVLTLCVLYVSSGTIAVAHAEAPVVLAPTSDVTAVVRWQLAALEHGDELGAWSALGPAMQARYGDPATFAVEASERWGPLLHSHRRDFGAQVSMPSGEVGQWVDVIGPGGEAVRALVLLRHLDGRWKVTGCLLFGTTA